MSLSKLINLSVKSKHYLEKVSNSGNSCISVSDNWAEFAPTTKIRSGVKIIPFEPYSYQKTLIQWIENHYATVIVKTRQLGLTECIANYFLWKAIKHPGYVAVILSKGGADTSNIAKRIRGMGQSLIDLGLEFENDAITDIKLKNGGRLVFRPSTPNGVRGLESVSDILFDEVGFVDNIEQIYTSALPSTEMLGDDARIIFISTPNGKSGFFWDKLALNNPQEKDIETLCDDIKSDKIDPIQYWSDSNGWAKFIIHWKAHPIYSKIPNYLESIAKKKQLSESAIQQEYNLSFNESEVIVFPNDLVRANAIGNFEKASINKRYFVGVDTSTVGDDYTVCLVISEESDRFNVVKLYRKRKASMEYNISQMIEIFEEYQPIKIGIEITGGTGQVYLEQLSKHFQSSKIEAIRTTGDTKPQMIDRLLLALERRSITYPPGIISDELLSYRRVGPNLNRLEALPGKHDDCVMSLAFALTVSPFNRKGTGFDITTIPVIKNKI